MRSSLRSALFCAAALTAAAQTSPSPDLTKQPTLYAVGYAHLDTEWRWEYPQVISEFLPNTMHANFSLFEKYPHYIFNFSGANRYRLMKEYYPADYEKIRQYVKAGRWFPAGSSMEEGDVNAPNAESILRQILYGNRYFQKDFQTSSAEYMLPDCFGFPETLPSLLAHAGVKGFSTQKLTWGSAAPVGGPDSPERTPKGTPFNVGLWIGPDGNGVIAALNPGVYSGDVTYDLSKSPGSDHPHRVDWVKRIERDGRVSGLMADYHYYGTGDIGGSPRESSVSLIEAMVTKSDVALPTPKTEREGSMPVGPKVEVGNGPVHVLSTEADQMFLDILQSGKQDSLPKYKGDLELTNHSAGSLTSEAYQKRWNRKNELLADAAEKASVAASWLGGKPYPQERLNNAWTLVMGGQFHDIMAGTATPQAYEYSWNDDVIAMNQFADVMTSGVQSVAAELSTRAKGKPIVVYNPLAIGREDIVEADLPAEFKTASAVQVLGPDERSVPAQVENGKVLFVAKAPSTGFAVYDVLPAAKTSIQSALKISERYLENSRYRVTVNDGGDVSSIFDKKLNHELLASPLRLAFQTEKPEQWPAWNMDWSDQSKPPRGYVDGPAQIRIVENGPVRIALQIARKAEGSIFVQTISLSAGDAGNRVEFGNVIDWKSQSAALKATFHLTAANPVATYNWDVATIERRNNDPRKFEVPSHQFIDLTDRGGAYGVTVLTDCKNGSDKPDDSTLRLTLIYTPGISEGGKDFSDQSTQDWGRHQFAYGLTGHAGDWRKEQTDWQALRLNQPLLGFWTESHDGSLGKQFSLARVNNSRVRVMAIKKAEEGDEVVVRAVEVDGKPQARVRLAFAAPLTGARELNGQEQPIGPATVSQGVLVADFAPNQIRTFAVRLTPPNHRESVPVSQPVKLDYDRTVASVTGSGIAPGFDDGGRSLAAEMLPNTIDYNGVQFKLGTDALTPRGQTITLPSTDFNRVYLLAAAFNGDQPVTFKVGEAAVNVTVEDWGGFIGQWDDRIWQKNTEDDQLTYAGLKPGFIKRESLAWFVSHRHSPAGLNEPYSYSYLFAYALDLPSNVRKLEMPDNANVRILAVSVARTADQVKPAQVLYDSLTGDSQ